jgi:hypothetical protein
LQVSKIYQSYATSNVTRFTSGNFQFWQAIYCEGCSTFLFLPLLPRICWRGFFYALQSSTLTSKRMLLARMLPRVIDAGNPGRMSALPPIAIDFCGAAK